MNEATSNEATKAIYECSINAMLACLTEAVPWSPEAQRQLAIAFLEYAVLTYLADRADEDALARLADTFAAEAIGHLDKLRQATK